MVHGPDILRARGTIAFPPAVVGTPAETSLRVEPAGALTHTVAIDYTWPKCGYDASDTRTSPDPTVSSADATSRGVKWMGSTDLPDAAPDRARAVCSAGLGKNQALGSGRGQRILEEVGDLS